MKVEAFEAVLAAMHASLGPWRSDTSPTEWRTLADAAQRAADQTNGLAVLLQGREVPLRLTKDGVTVQYVGECDDEQGVLFHGFLFAIPRRLEVMAWVEDDGPHVGVRWRGDRPVFEELTLRLKLFSDAWLRDLSQLAPTLDSTEPARISPSASSLLTPTPETF